eukprot:12865.XXX_930214_930411_1 [CDS] Oithona nana genome sequencing.
MSFEVGTRSEKLWTDLALECFSTSVFHMNMSFETIFVGVFFGTKLAGEVLSKIHMLEIHMRLQFG